MTAPEIILASVSPRRAALLEQVGVRFRTLPSTLGEDGETQLAGEGAEGCARRLALAKAGDVARTLSHGLVIGADTVVTCDERVLGKPRSPDEAQTFLLYLAGRAHHVITGVAVVEVGTGRAEVDAAMTEVTMRPFDATEAARYVATGEPMDKAGAYGIQGRGALLVAGIRGDYFNVVGLPLVLLAALLRRFGVDPWDVRAAP